MGANVNLLASGYHQPLGGQLGSGIYSGHFGALNYTFDPTSGTKLIISEIPIIPNEIKLVTDEAKKWIFEKTESREYHSFLQENLKNYSTIQLDMNGEGEETVCHNEFCCNLKYNPIITKLSSNSIFQNQTRNYRLVAFNGTRPVAQETSEFNWQVCGVVRCLNDSIHSCTMRETNFEFNIVNFDSFQLSSSDFHLNQVMKPSLNTLDTKFRIIPFHLFNFTRLFDLGKEEKQNIVQASSNLLGNISLQTIGIINRMYNVFQ